MDTCGFCGRPGDFGFDWDWDAVLCWSCHFAQRLMLLMVKYSARRHNYFSWN